jgi:heme/copper-type cytochrome/quinol oxidase subunit 1
MTTATQTKAPAAVVAASSPEPAGLYRVVTTGDHKTVGRLYIGFSLLGVLAALVVGVLSQIERLDPTSVDLLGNATAVQQAFEFWRAGLVFLGILPLFVGLGLAIVPMQVGSPSGAFPRAAAASFWGWLLGAGMFVAGFVSDGGLGGSPTGVRERGVALCLVGLGLMVLALILASVCLATTVLALRTTGLTLRRVPLFSWSILVASTTWLLTLPVLFAGIVVAYVDFRHGRTGFGIPGAIGTNLGWAWRQPQTLAYIIPATGVIGEIIPVFARTRRRHHEVSLGAITLFGIVSFGAFDQPWPQVEDRFVYIVLGFAAVLPVLVLAGTVADTLRAGKPKGLPAAHVGLAIAALLGLLLAVVVGALRVLAPNQLELLGSSATDAQYNAALLAGLAAGLAGVLYWGVKIVGRDIPAALPRLAGLALLGGILLAGVADLVSGFLDQPAGAGFGPVDDSVKVLNGVSMVGVALALLGGLAVVLSIVGKLRTSAGAPRDPWGGHTLEWDTASPPPQGNFAGPVPVVVSETPLLDRMTEEVA